MTHYLPNKVAEQNTLGVSVTSEAPLGNERMEQKVAQEKGLVPHTAAQIYAHSRSGSRRLSCKKPRRPKHN